MISMVDIQEYFQIDKTASIINENKFKNIALQVPNILLSYISDVERELKKQCENCHFYVLADETYGSCCIDIITAKHYIPDLLIHYGNACYNHSNASYPILYCCVGEKNKVLDRSVFKFTVEKIGTTRPLIIFYDLSVHITESDIINICGNLTVVAHPCFESMKLIYPISKAISGICSSNMEKNVNCCKTTFTISSDYNIFDSHSEYNENDLFLCGRKLPKNLITPSTISEYDILLITTENPVDDKLESNLLLAFPQNKLYIFNNNSLCNEKEQLKIIESSNNIRHLVKRMALINRINNAQLVGLLLYGPAVKEIIPLAQNLKKIINSFGKKCVSVSLGRITVAKLANFLQVDIWVSLSCYNNMYMDNTELYKPVVTPLELIQGLIQNQDNSDEVINTLTFPFPMCTLADINHYIIKNMNKLTALTTNSDHNNNQSVDDSLITDSHNIWSGLEKNYDAAIGTVIDGLNGIAAKYNHDI